MIVFSKDIDMYTYLIFINVLLLHFYPTVKYTNIVSVICIFVLCSCWPGINSNMIYYLIPTTLILLSVRNSISITKKIYYYWFFFVIHRLQHFLESKLNKWQELWEVIHWKSSMRIIPWNNGKNKYDWTHLKAKLPKSINFIWNLHL